MGLFWMESFESANLGLLSTKVNANGTLIVSSGGTSSSTPRTGNRKGVSDYKLLFGSADQDDLIILGSAYQFGVFTGEYVLARFFGDARGTPHLTVTIDPTGAGNPATIKVYRGTEAGTLLGTSSAFTMPPSGTWMHFEFKVRLHDSAGSVVVRRDEQVILNLSGVDTKNGGSGSVFDGLDVVGGDTVGAPGNYTASYDDVYLANEQGSVNTDFQGAKRVEALDASGNGNSSQGVGSDGNSVDNFGLVADASTSTYVDLATTGDKDTYVHVDSALPTGNAVAGVFVLSYARKTDAGSRSLIPVARLSGTESDGTYPALLNGTDQLLAHVFETKPGGGGWSVADVNNAEFGYKAGA